MRAGCSQPGRPSRRTTAGASSGGHLGERGRLPGEAADPGARHPSADDGLGARPGEEAEQERRAGRHGCRAVGPQHPRVHPDVETEIDHGESVQDRGDLSREDGEELGESHQHGPGEDPRHRVAHHDAGLRAHHANEAAVDEPGEKARTEEEHPGDRPGRAGRQHGEDHHRRERRRLAEQDHPRSHRALLAPREQLHGDAQDEEQDEGQGDDLEQDGQCRILPTGRRRAPPMTARPVQWPCPCETRGSGSASVRSSAFGRQRLGP